MEKEITLKDVYVISDNGEGEDKKSYWTKIGTGFVNKDGSINVILQAFPVNGKLHIRDRVKEKKAT